MSAAAEKLRMLANDLDWFNYDLPSEVIYKMRGIAAAMEDEFNRMGREYSAELQAAMTENAELREDNDRLIQAVEDLHDVKLEDKLVQLENENEKLRELAKAMKPFLCCMPFASCDTLAANVRDRMRELGIEV